jgi:glycosyltransferase involved in cell wall biosynthesis
MNATMSESRGAVFVMPRKSTEWADAPAMWITAAGWARAAQRRFGHAWVVTRDRIASPDETIGFTQPRTRVQAAHRKIPAPEVIRIGAKDLLRARAARDRDDTGERADWNGVDLAFVWQHHDLFHTAGEPLARRHGVPLVSYVHAPQVWESARWGIRRPGWGAFMERHGERPQLLRSDVVACVSQEVATEVLRLGVEEHRVLVSPMAVDADRFSPAASGYEVRRRFGLGESFVIGWTGSFRRFHGLELAIQAFAVLHQASPESRLLLVGDGAERSAIELLAQELSVGDAVVFAGAVNHEELPAYVAAMDATVVTARVGEAFHYSPLKLREYLAAARPVVAPRVGDIARTLKNDLDALLYEPGDVAGLAEGLRSLHDNPALRSRLGSAGRTLMERTGTWDVQLGLLLDSDAFRSAQMVPGRTSAPTGARTLNRPEWDLAIARPGTAAVRSPALIATKALDVALWQIPRSRHKRFDRSELLVSRERRYEGFDSDCGDPELDAEFTLRRKRYRELEYVLRAEHVTVEPRYGFAFLSPLRVLFESLNPKCVRWSTARASVTALMRARLGDRHFEQMPLPSVVSLRDFNETNYWHFFNDLFPKLLMAQEVGIPDDVPALVSRRLTETPFYELVSPIMSTYRPIVVQEANAYVRADEFFWSATLNNDIRPFDVFLDDLDIQDAPAIDEVSGRDRIAFITRSPDRVRRVTNIDEIHEICTSLGMEVLDFDDIRATSVPGLMKTFETVVGLHGAGLTNVMFRRGLPTRLGELIMEDWRDSAYSQVAHHFGYQYRALQVRRDVDAPKGEDVYRVDPERFRLFVHQLLSLPPTCHPVRLDPPGASISSAG